MTKGTLNKHLAEVDIRAEKMFQQLVKSLAEKENVTDKLEKRGSKNQKCYKIKHYGVTNVAVDVTDSYF